MARVFISYRRSESKWAAGRLYDRLAELIGRDNLFFDVSNIEPGEDFVSRIREIVGSCDVLLAVIGPNWSTIQDGSGKPRLHNARDLVRIELAAALQRNIRVIPILVDGAAMPEEDQLPADLAILARRNAHDVSFAHFHTDLDSFVRVLQRILAGPGGATLNATPPEPPKADAKTAAPVVARLPFTISLTTVGDVATPLIGKGADLPAQASETFSTAADNQNSVEVNLCLGERPSSRDNVPIGKFVLAGIPPAARGIPQITITAIVDTALILTVTAEDAASKHKQVLDAVDLTRVDVPPEMLKESALPFQAAKSMRDSPVNLSEEASGSAFADIFQSFFGALPGIDINLSMTLSAAEASAGGQHVFELPNGRQITARFPSGIRDGQKIRLKGQGTARKGGAPGDVYIEVRVAG
jgi:hypothetical protein